MASDQGFHSEQTADKFASGEEVAGPDSGTPPAIGLGTDEFRRYLRGPDALAELREYGDPAVDTVGPLPYQALQALTDAGNPPGRRNYWHSDLFADLPDAAIDTLVDRANSASSPASVMILAPSGGAVADMPEDATPIGGRSANWYYHCYGIWSDTDDTRHTSWVKATAEALRPWTTAGMALNFYTDVDNARVRSAFGEQKYRRLVTLKDRYDPDNVFRRNQNVRPSAAT